MPEAGVGRVAGEMDEMFLLSLNKLKNKRRAKDLSRHFFQRYKGPNRYFKRCSTSLVIRVMQIKTRIGCHFICTRIAIKRKTKITSIGNYLKKSEPLCIVGRNVKVGTDIMQDGGSIPLLGTYQRNAMNIFKRYLHLQKYNI